MRRPARSLAIVIVGAVVATACTPMWSHREGDPPRLPPAHKCWGWSVPGDEASVPGQASPPLPQWLRDQRDALLADQCLRLNQIQVMGTHNSYHLMPQEPLWSALLAFSDEFLDWEYDHSPLAEQFEHEGIRQIELDVYADPEGGRYANRAIMPLLGLPAASGIPELDEPGYKVLHVHEVDFETTCHTLVSCLEEVRAWSDANPGHLPIAILVELLDTPIPDPVDAGFVQPLPIGPAELDALDEEIRSVFPEERMITPDDVRGRFNTLEEAVLIRGWPTLGESRGKVLFLMDNAGSKRADYLIGRPTLEGRVLFTNATPGAPDAAFVKRNDPRGANLAAIQELVRTGYVVRTRSDVPTFEARTGDTTRRDAALESAAQWVSTDYPVPGRAAPLGSDYVAQIPDGQPARCNPVITGFACRNDMLERLP